MSDLAASDQRDVMAEAPPFHHLHPLTIFVMTFNGLGRNLLLIPVLYFSVFNRNLGLTALGTAAVIGLIIGFSALRWSRFTYQVTDKEIRIKSGLLHRNNRSIPFDRIQDVSLEQQLLARILGLATVRLETGSGGGDDGTLDALSLADAEQFRDFIRDYKREGAGDSPGDIVGERTGDAEASQPAEQAEYPIFAMDMRRILIAGLFNFSFILLAILGTVAQNFDFLLPDGFFDPRNWLDSLPDSASFNSLSAAQRLIGAIGAITTLLFIGVTSGLVSTLVREYGFRLDLVPSRRPGFRRRRGLFTLTDLVLPIHRIQAAVLQSGPVRELHGWHHLKFTSLASDPSGETDHSSAPCAQMAEINAILGYTSISNAAADLAYSPVNPAFWWRRAVMTIVLIGAISGLAATLFHGGFYALLLLAVPLIILNYLDWLHHQFAIDGGQLFVRSGWWRRRLTILPIRKIQSVDVSQSPLDHPLDLATITIGIAGGSALTPLKIEAISKTVAMQLRSHLLHSTESHLTGVIYDPR